MIRTSFLIKYIPATALAFALSGCGTSNDSAPALTATGKHPSNWYIAHRLAYSKAYQLDHARQCQNCHGTDLAGGITEVGCSTTSCHTGGHPPRQVPHAVPFLDPALHGPAAKADLVYCQACHGQLGGAGSNPRFNLSISSLATGCSSNGCHNRATPTQYRYTSAAHPIPWSAHISAGNVNNACSPCHGILLNGGVGRACSSCHTNLTIGAVPVVGQCTSCHGKPPSGSTFPNTSGAHRAHIIAINSVSDNCTFCHRGAGSSSTGHSRLGRAIVTFPAAINAKSNIAIYSSTLLSCSGTSCHGGLLTPSWRGEKIDTSSQCTLCHTFGTSAQTPQYNSYWSGQHDRHVRILGMLCTDCHDMKRTNSTTGASHFSGLGTPEFELSPVLTIKPGINYASGSCNPGRNPTGYSFGVCHTSEPW